MPDLTYYAAKIAECLRLLESSSDPLYRDVYQAMADEFAEKYAALSHRATEQSLPAVPPSPLLSRIAPPPPVARPRPAPAQPGATGQPPKPGTERTTTVRRR